jgi:site-specific DNA recombinase
MKKRAILYTRVSTDEQNNGFSPLDQKDKLYNYCLNQDVEVIGFYHDDESGKSFDRPEWIKIMSFLKKNQGSVDFIYFMKWDRFSRNVAEAYITIKNLKKLGVEPQSIEQPLDFEIPESKIMLAIYLAAPEVDNDRRALNIFNGIRRGKKEGRWLGGCLRGYKNARDENNRPIVTLEGGPMEKLVRKAFKEFATGVYSIEELRHKLNKEGLKSTRNAFWNLLRNKGYIGKVFVPAFKTEPPIWVEGDHDALIDESTFYAVQDILEGRKKKTLTKIKTLRPEFPLRGFLACPQCAHTLTASLSKGRSGEKFAYYHCLRGCNERQKAEFVNESFEKMLISLKTNENTMKLYAKILKEKLKENNSDERKEQEKRGNEIVKQNQRLKNAKDLMLDGEISSFEYKEMRIEITEKIRLLSNDMANANGDKHYDRKLDSCLELLLNLSKYYQQSDTSTKQKIVGSIFPEKLIFENKKYRTAKINSVIPLICRQDGLSKGGKKRKHTISDMLSCQVVPTGIEPVTQGFSVLCSTD